MTLRTNYTNDTISEDTHPEAHNDVNTRVNALDAGAVLGPASATDGHVPQFDGVTGKLLKDGLRLDTDNTLAGNSDTRIPSQKAVKGYVDTASGLLVPKSLVDAKGDLLVGTADNTVARKAVGTNGQALLADSGASDGLSWVTQFVTDTHANRLAAAHKAGRLWKETDTGLIYLDDGTNWVIYKGEGHVRKTADEIVNNSLVVQNDDHLLLPVEANEVWKFELLALVNCVTATPGTRFIFTGPAGSTITWWNATNDGNGLSNPVAAQVTFSNPAGISGIRLAGWIANGATAGTLRLQWAQRVATAEDTKVLANSLLLGRRIV